VPAGTVVTSWNSPKYGEILTGANGRVLYLFTPDDATGTPTCTGSCAAAWPPLMASGAPHAEGQVNQSLLGVSGGQVTYNGHPLYFYAADSGPDQTNGQGSGGIWYVVTVAGAANMSP
jgi:predicted lipoprotein with Yx(FWY)xxD motif